MESVEKAAPKSKTLTVALVIIVAVVVIYGGLIGSKAPVGFVLGAIPGQATIVIAVLAGASLVGNYFYMKRNFEHGSRQWRMVTVGIQSILFGLILLPWAQSVAEAYNQGERPFWGADEHRVPYTIITIPFLLGFGMFIWAVAARLTGRSEQSPGPLSHPPSELHQDQKGE